MQLIRGSELSDFLRCRLRWKMAWIDNLESKRPNNKLFFGTLFHKFLEMYYTTQCLAESTLAVDRLIQETDTSSMDETEYSELIDLFVHVKHNYFETYKTDFNNWEVIATELTFAIPLDDEIGYTGTIDLIVRDKKDGRIYFLDHKTTQSIDKYDKNSDMDRQISRYWWALQQLSKGNGYIQYFDTEGETHWMHVSKCDKLHLQEPSGFIYNIILKDYPVPPKVLKDGSLSKAKNQNTSYDLYMKSLQDMGMEPPKDPFHEGYHIIPKDHPYYEILVYLAEYPKEYFRRIEVRRNQAEIDAAMQEFYYVASDIKLVQWALRHGTGEETIGRTYRNITSDCHWDCPYMALCKAGLDGSDTEYLKDELYKEKEEQTWHFKL